MDISELLLNLHGYFWVALEFTVMLCSFIKGLGYWRKLFRKFYRQCLFPLWNISYFSFANFSKFKFVLCDIQVKLPKLYLYYESYLYFSITQSTKSSRYILCNNDKIYFQFQGLKTISQWFFCNNFLWYNISPYYLFFYLLLLYCLYAQNELLHRYSSYLF